MTPIAYADPDLEPFRAVLRKINAVQADFSALCRKNSARLLRAVHDDPLSEPRPDILEPFKTLREEFVLAVPTHRCDACKGAGCDECEFVGYEWQRQRKST